MRTLCSTVIAISLTLVGCSPSGTGLSFQSPTGWKVDHKKAGGFHSYTLADRNPSGGFLEFSQWPAPNNPEDIQRLIHEVVASYLKEARTSSEFTIASTEYRIQQFVGEHCQGSYATFRMSGGLTNNLQVIFMMSVGSNVWNGQFTGPSEVWKQALTVLESVRKDG
jgi:hypothetical protein